jgi:hypothetical protein
VPEAEIVERRQRVTAIGADFPDLVERDALGNNSPDELVDLADQKERTGRLAVHAGCLVFNRGRFG